MPPKLFSRTNRKVKKQENDASSSEGRRDRDGFQLRRDERILRPGVDSKKSRSLRDAIKVFYVNVTVIDASDAVYHTVHAKVRLIPGTKGFKEGVAKAVAERAAVTVHPKHIAKKLAIKVPKILMYQLSRKGLLLHAETVFMQHTYFVIQLQVQHADPMLLAQSAADGEAKNRQRRMNHTAAADGNDNDDDDVDDEQGDDDDSSMSVASSVIDDWLEQQEHNEREQVSSPYVARSRLLGAKTDTTNALLSRKSPLVRCLGWFLSMVSPRYRHYLESCYLPNLIQAKISEKVNEMLRKKLDDKYIVAETEVLMEDKQARYFFRHLQVVRDMEKESKK